MVIANNIKISHENSGYPTYIAISRDLTRFVSFLILSSSSHFIGVARAIQRFSSGSVSVAVADNIQTRAAAEEEEEDSARFRFNTRRCMDELEDDSDADNCDDNKEVTNALDQN